MNLRTINAGNRGAVFGWFLLINTLISVAVASRYYVYLPPAPDALTSVYAALALFGQMSLLAGLLGLFTLPLAWLGPPRLQSLLMALLASLVLSLLYVDTLVFDQYRFHINAVVLELVLSGQIVEFPPRTWITVLGGIAVLCTAEYLLHRWLSTGPGFTRRRYGRGFIALATVSVLATHVMHIWAAANVVQPMTNVTRFLPLFYPTFATKEMRRLGLVDEEALARQQAMTLKSQGTLAYPARPLLTEPVERPVDIVFLVIECWRVGSFNSQYTPNLWEFTRAGTSFDHHLSTGNATRTSIFGLFYGIPGTYWHAFLSNRRSPVLLDRLQQLDYELGIFASAHLESPEFHETVFVNVPDLRMRTRGDSKAERDVKITDEWLSWYAARDLSRPTFSFLFYDAPHGYDFVADYPQRFEPMAETIDYLAFDEDYDPTPVRNRYYTSMHFTDSQIGRVLDVLRSSERDTVIVITGDHAQELNDNGLNYWGHNGNFSDAQIHVPFVLLGPGIGGDNRWNEAGVMSSHEDLAPTLLRRFLGVSNELSDFSTGVDLLGEPVQRDWLISSNYSAYAIIEQDAITHVSAGGGYRYLDRSNRAREGTPDYAHLKEALDAMSRFYR